jgi:hypothetical protein
MSVACQSNCKQKLTSCMFACELHVIMMFSCHHEILIKTQRRVNWKITSENTGWRSEAVSRRQRSPVKEEVCRSRAYGEEVTDIGSLSKSMSFRRKSACTSVGCSEEKHGYP